MENQIEMNPQTVASPSKLDQPVSNPPSQPFGAQESQNASAKKGPNELNLNIKVTQK